MSDAEFDQVIAVQIKSAVDAFGGVTSSWQTRDLVIAVRLRGTYKCAKAVWPIFQKQRYGRIVTTCSPVGVYGNFGQTNYCAAKATIMGFTKTLAFEGNKYDILCNIIVPSSGTSMTMTISLKEMVDAYKPDYIAPIVGYLTSQDNTDDGWATETRWQRTGGHGLPTNVTLTPEDILAKWDMFINFDDGRATYPVTSAEGMATLMANLDNTTAEPVKSKL
ncbi:NAD(P)-binding protein [Imleria badia]|nr:NAD(P)-binding protein [Imleria badia]